MVMIIRNHTYNEYFFDQVNTKFDQVPYKHKRQETTNIIFRTSCKHPNTLFSLLAFQCLCEPGWEGPTCSQNINECNQVPNPCLHNSVCIDRQGTYECLCSDYWTGKNCK